MTILRQRGAVVHLASGASGLACAVALGRRRGYRTEYMAPHSLPLALVGSGLLWVGWLVGFNGGSARGANMTAVGAIMASHTAAATAALTWMAVEWMHRGKPTLLGTITGAVSGLATITPAAAYIGPGYAVIFGVGGGRSVMPRLCARGGWAIMMTRLTSWVSMASAGLSGCWPPGSSRRKLSTP